MRKPSANRSSEGGHRRRRAGTQGPRPGKSSPLLPPVQTKQGRERASEGPGGSVNQRGRGLGRRGEWKEGRSGRGRQTKGTTSGDPSAPPPPPRERHRRPELAASATRFWGPASPRPLPARLFRPPLPLRCPLPGARVPHGLSAPLPLPLASAAAVLQAQPPSSAAPPPCPRPRVRAPPPQPRPPARRRPRPQPAGARERGDVPPRPSARGRERSLRDGVLRGRGCESRFTRRCRGAR
ncbi:formin-like protein 5 [Rousettus aegyptiacus]|uniref:formin-like protein 5 n=1 Tax=Rousettus aegyptiacus TaxID=9407 RepID=UPI00168D11D0|nr:formin-like protein 5 [Rousettus aegyptiacus]